METQHAKLSTVDSVTRESMPLVGDHPSLFANGDWGSEGTWAGQVTSSWAYPIVKSQRKAHETIVTRKAGPHSVITPVFF